MLVSVGCSSAQLGRSFNDLARVHYESEDLSDASCSSSIDDFFVQAEKRVVRLEAVRPQSDACKRKLHQLKALCEQNAILRLYITYDSLLNKLDSLYAEVRTVADEQTAFAENQPHIREQGSRLECFELFVQWLRALVEKWTRLASTISTNRWFRRTLPVRIAEHREKTTRFTTTLVSSLQTINEILGNGVTVLACLKPSQITEQFLMKFADALNDLNVTLRLTRRLATDDLALLTSVPAEVSLTTLFDQLAHASGSHLAAQIIDAMTPYRTDDGDLNEFGDLTIVEAEGRIGKMFLTLSPSADNGDDQPHTKQRSSEVTSDYSSASSQGSTGTADLSGKHATILVQPTPPIKRVMQQLYTVFLERRYSLFVALVDSASGHKSLNADFKPRNRRQRGVSWLDDCVRNQRKRLWKHYVQAIWNCYQNKLVDGLVPVLLSHSPPGFVSISQCLSDTLLSVPLPEHVASSAVASNRIFTIARQRLFVHGIAAITTAVANNRLNEQHMPLARLLIDRIEDSAGRKSLADHFGSLTSTRSDSFLAQYDMNSFFTMRFIFHGIITMDEEPWLTKNMLQSIVRDKVTSILIIILPPKDFWCSHSEETSGYVERLMVEILEPISFASAKIPMHYRPPINQMVVDQLVITWMRHFFDNDIKLSSNGASKLQRNLWEAERWITCNYVFQSVDLTTLKTAAASVKSLEGKRRQSVASFTRNQVSPNSPSNLMKDGTVELVDIDWNRLRAKPKRFAQSCFTCFSE